MRASFMGRFPEKKNAGRIAKAGRRRLGRPHLLLDGSFLICLTQAPRGGRRWLLRHSGLRRRGLHHDGCSSGRDSSLANNWLLRVGRGAARAVGRSPAQPACCHGARPGEGDERSTRCRPCPQLTAIRRSRVGLETTNCLIVLQAPSPRMLYAPRISLWRLLMV